MTINIPKEKFINAIKETKETVQSVTIERQKFWVKKARKSKTKRSHILQKCVAFVIPLKILKPTVSKGGSTAIVKEGERLKRFKKAGICVPPVVYCDETALITLDAGIILQDALNGENSDYLLLQATKSLASLHSKNLYHGRPYMKDFIYNHTTNEIGFLDLEEDPLNAMNPAQAQARDVFLFFAGISIHTDKMDKYFETYASNAPSSFRKPLRRLIKFLVPIACLIEWYSNCKVGKDTHKVLNAVRFFKNKL